MSLRRFTLLFCGLVLCPRAFAQNASIRDYTVPVSTVQNLRADFNFNYSAAGSDLTGRNGRLGFTYTRFKDALSFAYSIDAIGSGALSRDTGAAKDTTQFATNLATRVKKYILWGTAIFAFGDVGFDYDKTFDRPATAVTVGLGDGRFIDATSLAKAVRVEEFLLREKAISDHLPKDHLIELGHIIEKEREYKERFGSTYRKWWFAAMEKLIRESGVAPRGIGAGGILRINEVLFQQRVNSRFYGSEFSFGVNFQTTAPYRGVPRRDPAAAAGFRHAIPLGWRSQFNQRLEVNSPFTGQFGKLYSARLVSDFVYEVSNRIDFTVRDILRAERSQGRGRQVGNSFGTFFSFFVENKTSFVIGVQIDKVQREPWTRSFTTSLNHRLL
ncbi:MAG: hypothetical protein A3F84_19570 [Candidatus Handelsmanbacteria bacterium RIFCSPLOWO2_12_FULL_64_10]|uniref:DUF5723 domain-containing protein n=1 Tax=Handelsmanbacteria sp. (strain RIFCSPLOWO2_12_FULL_64_10) TaxID=1817868 RepID=A0A1F6CBT3_HANXR|nr:MAG: hypothetical protein A3F84_19570 [Candidatus Handelsmanbacteria bacterium RIFCSPLOWO2_12_FULL_64_10]